MKYIAVDLGNVIFNVNFDPFLKSVQYWTGYNSIYKRYSEEQAYHFLEKIQKYNDLGITTVSNELEDCVDSFYGRLFLIKDWKDTIKINPIMFSFLSDLAAEGTKIALLSNIGLEHTEVVNKVLTLPLGAAAQPFFSCVVGARKPNLLYYKTFLDMFPEFKGCIYLDDREENIDIGTYFGFNSVYFALDKFSSEKGIKDKLSEIKSNLVDI